MWMWHILYEFCDQNVHSINIQISVGLDSTAATVFQNFKDGGCHDKTAVMEVRKNHNSQWLKMHNISNAETPRSHKNQNIYKLYSSMTEKGMLTPACVDKPAYNVTVCDCQWHTVRDNNNTSVINKYPHTLQTRHIICIDMIHCNSLTAELLSNLLKEMTDW